MAKPALGRGLSALLGGVSPALKPAPAPLIDPQMLSAPPDADTRERVLRISLHRIQTCPFQPRKDFSHESLRELADSIKEQGVVQPLIVREQGDTYELIAGERRWRAAQMLGLMEVPVIVREADDRTVLELALIENLQRENLNPIEEAQGYFQLIEQFQLKQEDVAGKVGKNRATVANALRLLKLAPEIQEHVRQGRLSTGHAKAILALDSADLQKLAAERAIKESLSVRQTEELVAHLQSRAARPARQPAQAALAVRDPQIADLENRLKQRLGTKVFLRYRQGKGAVEIRFFNDADLERILQILGLNLE
ncbi:MAG: ParB/RepB/Spo0J family partition protein [Chloroflexi bacterium]|nr:ParB/RepB/Spo0J family partition protein [Chloroflexota bacterium]